MYRHRIPILCIVHGGSWYNINNKHLCSTYRYADNIYGRADTVGVRLIRRVIRL